MIDINIQSKVYVDDKIISDLALSAQAEEIVAIVGPSGAGKSTLLNIIAGLDKDYSGSVQIGSAAIEKAKTAYMFQEPRLLPWRTVLQNVCLVTGNESPNIERAKSLLSKVGMADQLHAYPRQLSGGMRRRVSLARAFLPKPKLVLMDEPFLSLDSPSAEALRASFLEMWAECGATVLYVTHDLAEALSVADRVLFLSPSPASVVLEVETEEKRPSKIHGESVQLVQQRLLLQYPRLLNGYC